jgi:hypothetical protein
LTVDLGFSVIQFGAWSVAFVGLFVESQPINRLIVTDGIYSLLFLALTVTIVTLATAAKAMHVLP